MRSIVIAVAILAFVAVIQANFTPEQKEKITEQSKKCAEETGASMDQLKKVREGDWTIEDPALKKHAFCMLKAIEFLDVNGQFEKDTFYSKLPVNADREKMEAALNECFAEPRPPTNDEYAWNLLKCYHSKVKDSHSLF